MTEKMWLVPDSPESTIKLVDILRTNLARGYVDTSRGYVKKTRLFESADAAIAALQARRQRKIDNLKSKIINLQTAPLVPN